MHDIIAPNSWKILNVYARQFSIVKALSTLKNFPQKENFAKCDWPTQTFRRKKISSRKFSIFNNDIFGNSLSVEMGL
jgi:hypothetical protein